MLSRASFWQLPSMWSISITMRFPSHSRIPQCKPRPPCSRSTRFRFRSELSASQGPISRAAALALTAIADLAQSIGPYGRRRGSGPFLNPAPFHERRPVSDWLTASLISLRRSEVEKARAHRDEQNLPEPYDPSCGSSQYSHEAIALEIAHDRDSSGLGLRL